jgi:exopolysaccharide biosynthesis protein
MKRTGIYSCLILILLLSSQPLLKGQVREFRKIRWEKEEIASGLLWLSAHVVISDSLPQNINVLVADIRKREVALSYSPRKNVTVSRQAEAAGALAAVNAGFFNMQSNGSVTYIRVNGKIEDPDTVHTWNKKLNMTGSLLISDDGKVIVQRAKGNNWYDSHTEYKDILVTGPLLLEDRRRAVVPSTQLALDKHPRTAIGTRGKRKVLLITVDGRDSQAKGMTLKELTDLMKSLKIRDGVNLDGGGSTTMWIAGKPFSGVVSMPSDNRVYDHEGERPVANIVIIK